MLADFTSAVNHSGKWGKSDVARLLEVRGSNRRCVVRTASGIEGAMLAIMDSAGAARLERVAGESARNSG